MDLELKGGMGLIPGMERETGWRSSLRNKAFAGDANDGTLPPSGGSNDACRKVFLFSMKIATTKVSWVASPAYTGSHRRFGKQDSKFQVSRPYARGYGRSDT
jgi:hypothetical protein